MQSFNQGMASLGVSLAMWAWQALGLIAELLLER